MVFRLSSLLIWCFVLFQASSEENQKVRLKSVKCFIGDAADIVTVHYCRIKPMRNSTSFLLNSTLHKPLKSPIFWKIVFFYKYGLIYREIIKIPECEVCSMLKNVNNAHPAIKAAIDVIGKSISELMKGCPYQIGNYSISVTHDYSNFPSIIPSGMYKGNISMRTSYGKTMSLVYEAEVVSSIRTSFWYWRFVHIYVDYNKSKHILRLIT